MTTAIMTAAASETKLATRTAATWRPVLKADWREALFIHFRVDARELQAHVPLELDLFEGWAYVSLVAFRQEHLRPTVGGRLSAWLSGPLARHEFLNVRTYVRRGNERGIYFLAEWIPNRLATLIGPPLYGLPYRLGRMNYGGMAREVTCGEGRLACRAEVDADETPSVCRVGTEAAFLLERYVAFTSRHGVLRRFRIAHEPWRATAARVVLTENTLPVPVRLGEVRSAHYCEGVNDVAIGRPKRLTPRREGAAAWMPLVVSPLVVWMMRDHLTPWVVMWGMAVAIFLGCKVVMMQRALGRVETTGRRVLPYLLLWPGMDAEDFLNVKSLGLARRPHGLEARATMNAVVGAGLLWGVARYAAPLPLLAGWVGMVGLILVMHFGVFELIGCAWRRRGVDAEPLMDRPIRSSSVGEFWGRRWNSGFHRLADDLLFAPLRRRMSAAAAMLVTFVVSGIVHELVITVPAGGGYGGPTAYFTIQGLAIAVERSRMGRRLGLRRGVRGWLFAMAATLVPVGLLFPPTFVGRVVVPFLHFIGAMPKGAV